FGSFVSIPATQPAAPLRTLRATLTVTGARVSATRVPRGPHAITVVDRSKVRGFRLVGPAVIRRTTRAFVGTTTWRVTLEPGVYRFGNDLRLTGRLTVS